MNFLINHYQNQQYILLDNRICVKKIYESFKYKIKIKLILKSQSNKFFGDIEIYSPQFLYLYNSIFLANSKNYKRLIERIYTPLKIFTHILMRVEQCWGGTIHPPATLRQLFRPLRL